MPKKGEKPLTIESIKNALLPSIAEMFETQTVLLDKRMDRKLEEKLEQKLEQKFEEKLGSFKIEMKKEIVHEIKVLLENDERLNAFSEVSRQAEIQSEKTDDHETRIAAVEKDVKVLKAWR